MISKRILSKLGTDLVALKKKFGDQVDLWTTRNEFVDFDIEAASTHGRLSNEEILADINNDQVEIFDKKDEESVEVKYLSLKKQALISDFFLKKQIVPRRKYCCILMIPSPLYQKS